MREDKLPFNQEFVERHFDGDWDYFQEVAKIFLGAYSRLLKDIRDAISIQDAARICLTAHSIKGTLANFGDGLALETATALEDRSRSGDTSQSEEKFQILEREVKHLVGMLNELVKEEA